MSNSSVLAFSTGVKVGKEDTAVIASSAELRQTELYRKKFLWDFLPWPSLPAISRTLFPNNAGMQAVATAGGMKFKHGKSQKIGRCVMSLFVFTQGPDWVD